MKKIKSLIFLFVFVFFVQMIFAQKNMVNEYASVDKKALQLPDSLTKTTDGIASYIAHNFTTDNDKARAAFIWITSNIQYDVDNMFAINFYEKREDKIAKALQTRKGICENYAALFNDICLKLGIQSYVVEGYTKQNGFTDYIPHAWCAASINGSWFLFDPTWGSGYMNGGKFYKKINNAYYKASPETLIKSHIPFDYLWQFLNYPVTNQEFYEGKTQADKSKQYFNYIDSIQVYNHESYKEQLVSSAYRVEKNGVKNSLIFDRLQHLKIEIENLKIKEANEQQTATVNIYNDAVAEYNKAINEFNAFIDYRNNRFSPMKADTEIQSMIDAPNNKLSEAKSKLEKINANDANINNSIQQLSQSISSASARVTEQENWLKEYFSKGKLGRKMMLSGKKITFFGVPLN